MIKKTITYTNFNDVEVTEDFYFHISKAELLEMEISANGTLREQLQAIVASNNGAVILPKFKEIIRMSFGRKTPEGAFLKRPEYFEAFEGSGAYEVMFLEFLQSPDAFANFVNGLVPADLAPAGNREARRAAARQPQDRQRPLGQATPQVTAVPDPTEQTIKGAPEEMDAYLRSLPREDAMQLESTLFRRWYELTDAQVPAKPKVTLAELQGGTVSRPIFETGQQQD